MAMMLTELTVTPLALALFSRAICAAGRAAEGDDDVAAHAAQARDVPGVAERGVAIPRGVAGSTAVDDERERPELVARGRGEVRQVRAAPDRLVGCREARPAARALG